MDHLAILNKHFLDKIISGEKTVESRWSKYKIVPFGKVSRGDTIYFKYSGGTVVGRSKVIELTSFIRKRDEVTVDKFVINNRQALGLENKIVARKFLETNKERNYVTFIGLDKFEHIKDFKINKEGHGVRSSWIVVDDIELLK